MKSAIVLFIGIAEGIFLTNKRLQIEGVFTSYLIKPLFLRSGLISGS